MSVESNTIKTSSNVSFRRVMPTTGVSLPAATTLVINEELNATQSDSQQCEHDGETASTPGRMMAKNAKSAPGKKKSTRCEQYDGPVDSDDEEVRGTIGRRAKKRPGDFDHMNFRQYRVPADQASPCASPSLTQTATKSAVPDGCELLDNGKRFKGNLTFGRQVNVEKYEGEWRVDIRVWKEGANKRYPTHQGVSLTPNRFKAFKIALEFGLQHLYEIEKDSGETKWMYHLGGHIYATVSKGYSHLDVRKYYIPDDGGSVLPGVKGVTLRIFQVKKLIEWCSVIEDLFPDIKEYVPCFDQPDHCSQENYFACTECCPSQTKFDN